jgi:gluconokinase
MMANLGCGVFDNSRMSSTIGTSGAMRISTNKPIIDPDGKVWCYCFTKDTWVAGGAINNGGIVLKWMRDEYRGQFEIEMKQMNEKSIYKLFDLYAEQINPGSDGLTFLPYLTGERSPGWHAEATGIMHGLQLLHGKKHYIRAAMEGVMYNMYSIYEAVTALNDNVKTIIANGGYANSPIWLQIQADIFNKEIAVADVSEAAALGAAYTGMVAVGAVKDFKRSLPSMQTSQTILPIQENSKIYKESYRQFQELYSKLIKDN